AKSIRIDPQVSPSPSDQDLHRTVVRIGPANCCGYDDQCKETYMNDSTKDKVEGAAHELKGKVKETVGHVIGSPDLRACQAL
ncbi:MAG: CsbD family protein, partial [Candidatus Acidiferrales bacterium]